MNPRASRSIKPLAGQDEGTDEGIKECIDIETDRHYSSDSESAQGVKTYVQRH